MKPVYYKPLIVNELKVKSVLSKTGIPGRKYCINPYVGCAHSCRYCYATFMKKYTGHTEPWGSFVDVKINAPEILRRQLSRAENAQRALESEYNNKQVHTFGFPQGTLKGDIIMSSVTDAYQPLEAKYRLTRKCLEVLVTYQFPLDILTKSPLVLRDIDMILKLKNARVGITITTDDENIRKIFEPDAPLISARIEALRQLHRMGIKTYAFIGPILPMSPESLTEKIKPYVQSVIIDYMNYISKVEWLYKKHYMEKWLDRKFIDEIISRLKNGLLGKNVDVC